MSVLTLEVPDKVLEKLTAEAQKAQMTVEQYAVSALFKQAKINQLREEVMLGVEQLRNGQSTAYKTADEMMDDIERQIKERLAQRANGNQE